MLTSGCIMKYTDIYTCVQSHAVYRLLYTHIKLHTFSRGLLSQLTSIGHLQTRKIRE